MKQSYYHTPESVSEYIRLAQDVSGADLIQRLSEVLPGGSRVLEIGSGPGTDWELLRQTYDVVGSDYSQEFVKHLEQRHPQGVFLELDASKMEFPGDFDAIYSNKVLHHLTDEELHNSVSGQSKVLNSGGIICHSFWKGEGSEIFKGLFVNYHTKEALRSCFEPDFEVILLEEYTEFEANDSVLLMARKR